MEPTRFEKNIILPYLQNIESNINSANRIKIFYCYLVESVIITEKIDYINHNDKHYRYYNWIFHDSNVSFHIKFNNEINIHFLLFVFRKYENKRQTPMINLSRLFSGNTNIEINKEIIYKDNTLFNKIITETTLRAFVRTIAYLYESINKNQQDAANEIEAFFV